MPTTYTLKQRLDILRGELSTERSTFDPHWREIADFMLPRRPLFAVTDTNKSRRNPKIVDPTATLALRTLSSGMMAGVTSPARPWFRLTTPDPDLSEFGPVKQWLHTVTQRMSTVFLRSNIYNSLPMIYSDMGGFATSALYIEEDFDAVIRTYVFPIGSYMIAFNERLQVDTFFREMRMTVAQLIKKFSNINKPDWSIFSTNVRNLWERQSHNAWVDLCHVIFPNEKYDGNGYMSNQKKYRSVYYEKSTNKTTDNTYYNNDVYLRNSGYDYFPVLVPRWQTTGEDIYGTDCPGMTALGDTKALMLMQRRRLQAIEKHVNPALTGPTSLKKEKVSLISGDVTYGDEMEGKKGLRPIHEVDPKLEGLQMAIAEHQFRIRRTFFEDLFLMLVNTDRREITAREIEERHEEKLLALGPVLEQLNQDLLDPLIDVTFMIMERQGLIPFPPEEIQGQALKVEYISILAQAQKMAGLAGIERFAGFAGQVAGFDPLVLDKIDRDQMIDEYADITGVPPRIIVSDENVQKIREGRARVQQQQAALANLAQGAKVAKDLAGSKTDEANVLTDLARATEAGRMA